MLGFHQIENACIALEVIDALNRQGYQIDEADLRSGLAKTSWSGRFEKLLNKPIVIIDGAHNLAGAKAFAASLDYHFTNRKKIYIMGILKDKDYQGITRDKIILDPGIGFAKSFEENKLLIKHLEVVKNLGFPVLYHNTREAGLKDDLVVKKPWAPIGLPLDTVSIEITRGWHKAYVGIGSNIGDKEAFLKMAITALERLKDTKVTKKSSLIVAEPYGYTDQEAFLNSCLELETFLPPLELLALFMEIGKKANRKREIHWDPRTLDLDLLLYDNQVIDEDCLIVPHPEMHLRELVLQPLSEIAAGVRHPLLTFTYITKLTEGGQDYNERFKRY